MRGIVPTRDGNRQCSISGDRREPLEVRKQTLASLLRGSLPGVQFNQHLAHRGDVVFAHACRMGLEGIVSKRLGSHYRSGRSSDWLKFKNPAAPAVQREAEEDWGGGDAGAVSAGRHPVPKGVLRISSSC
jgi:hypothetical protein